MEQKSPIEILKWTNATWLEIPSQDKPKENEECLIICKQQYVKPPKINTGEWEVLHWKKDDRDDGNWGLFFLGLFWELDHAELFAESISKTLNQK